MLENIKDLYFEDYIYIYAFSRRFYPKWLTLHSSYSFYILSALAFPGNRTHDLGVAGAMHYQLSYRKANILVSSLLRPQRYLKYQQTSKRSKLRSFPRFLTCFWFAFSPPLRGITFNSRVAARACTLPFVAIASITPYTAHFCPPPPFHVPLGLLVAYEGMSWSPAPEPAPRQRPAVPAPPGSESSVPAPPERPQRVVYKSWSKY